jgi:hypothetical protein
MAKSPQAQAKAIWRAMRREHGALTFIARALRIRPQAVHQWIMVPLDRVLDVERISGIPRQLLRPDYHLPTNGRQSSVQNVADSVGRFQGKLEKKSSPSRKQSNRRTKRPKATPDAQTDQVG